MGGDVCIKLICFVFCLCSWILHQLLPALQALLCIMKSIIAGASLLGLATAFPHQSHGYDGSPTVSVKNGTIAGLHSTTYNEDYFLGIPFAQPPVNELRFRNPQSYNSSYDGVFQATEYAPECYGYGVSSSQKP